MSADFDVSITVFGWKAICTQKEILLHDIRKLQKKKNRNSVSLFYQPPTIFTKPCTNRLLLYLLLIYYLLLSFCCCCCCCLFYCLFFICCHFCCFVFIWFCFNPAKRFYGKKKTFPEESQFEEIRENFFISKPAEFYSISTEENDHKSLKITVTI